MATGGIADGMTSSLQRFEQLANNIKRVPLAVWRRLCVVVFSLWLTFSLAQLFWLLLPAPALSEPPLTLPANAAFASRPASTTGSQVDIDALKELAPFGGEGDGVEVVEAPQPEGIEQEAVDSSLSIKLVGTVASNEERLAKAFIADGSKQDSFAPGEELTLGPSGVKLAKVMIDRVILDNNGRYETLWLYQGKDDFANASSGRDARQTYRRPQAQQRDRQVDSDSPDAVADVLPEEGQEEPTEDQIRTVNELINVSMHREGGQFIGFKINPKRDAELFTELGLEPNDIVTAVNNIGLDDTSRAMEVYRSLSTSSQASLEIMRDGVATTVTIDLDQY